MPDISVSRTTYIKIGSASPITTGIAEGSMLIDRVLFVDDFKFGQFASSRFEIQIYGINNVAGQNIEVYQTENNVRTDLFVGQIESSKLDNAGYYRDIIAYDKFYFIAKKNVADWFNGLWTNNTQISVLDAFKSLLTYFDIDYDTNTVVAANFVGNLYKTSVPSFEKISFKDMVKFLLEPLALIPYINASGDVAVYAPLMANNIDLYPLVDGVRQTRYDTNQSVFEEYEVLPMQWVGIQHIDSSVLQQAEITGNTSDIRYDLPYNPIRLDLYVEDAETAQEAVLEDFIDKAPFDAYTPCEVYMIVSDMSIKLGDKITTTRGTAYVSEMVLSGPMLVEQQLISRGSQVQQEVEEEYDPVFAYLDNRITETTDDLQQQLDDFEPSEEYLEKVGEFSDTIAGGMGLQVITYKAQDGSLLKYFYAPPPAGSAVTGIAGSNFIFTMKSTGFAWTNKWEGAPDASSESHVDPGTGDTVSTQWTSGISANGNALLKILNAYKISADIVTTGTLQSESGDVSIDLDNQSINFGNKLTYDPTNGLNIDGSVTIGGSASIGEAIEDTVSEVLSDAETEYAISSNGSSVPEEIVTTEKTFKTNWFYTNETDLSVGELKTILETSSSWNLYNANYKMNTNPYWWNNSRKYLYGFDRLEKSDGGYEISNIAKLATYGVSSGTSIVARTKSFVTSRNNKDDEAGKNYVGQYADSDLGKIHWSSGEYLYLGDRVLLEDGTETIENYRKILYGSGSPSVVLWSSDYFVADTVADANSTRENYIKSVMLSSSVDSDMYSSIYMAMMYPYIYRTTAWSNSRKYLKHFKATVYEDGTLSITNLSLIAEYGVSYPNFEAAWAEDVPNVSADNENPWSTTMPSIPENKGRYLWTRTSYDGGISWDYTVNYIGADGSNGQPGQDGTSVSISSIKYAVNQDQSTQPSASSFSTTFPSLSQGDWLWTKTTYSNGSTAIAKTYIGTDGEDGSSVAITSATKTNGVTTVVITDGSQTKTLTIADGADGDDGDPGLNGYVHVAWANSADGTTDFSTSVSANKTYLGTYTDNTAADSQSPSAYSWTLIKGAQGNPGNDGKGISSVTQYFHPDSSANISDIPAISDTSKWKTAPSDFTGSAAFSETNRYLWTYTKTVYTNPSSTVNGDRYILGVWGAPGSSGGGTQGRGITSIVTQYCLHTSNSTSSRPAENYSGWSDDMPAYSDGTGGVQRYYWQRDKITYDQALNGSTIQYTTPTLMQGVNKTMLEVNTLNADFARVIVKQNNQTYINGANIYTGTVTTDALAANAITTGKIQAGAVTADKITASQGLFNSIFAYDGTVENTISSVDKAVGYSKLILDFDDSYIQFNDVYSESNPNTRRITLISPTGITAYTSNDNLSFSTLLPDGLYAKNSRSGEESRYGYNSTVQGNLTVNGTISGKMSFDINYPVTMVQWQTLTDPNTWYDWSIGTFSKGLYLVKICVLIDNYAAENGAVEMLVSYGSPTSSTYITSGNPFLFPFYWYKQFNSNINERLSTVSDMFVINNTDNVAKTYDFNIRKSLTSYIAYKLSITVIRLS